jgi:hypothetical protein
MVRLRRAVNSASKRLVGGVALITAALWLDPSARTAIALCVGSLNARAVIGNFLGAGWMLYAISIALIVHSVLG